MYVEDLDLFDRAAEAGMRCVWVPAATVVHFGGRARVAEPAMYAHCLWNWRTYIARRRGALAGSTMLVCAVVGSGLRAAMWGLRSFRGEPDAAALSRMFALASVLTVRSAVLRRPPPRSRRPPLVSTRPPA
jgi:GT2 family glycosyltransferase